MACFAKLDNCLSQRPEDSQPHYSSRLSPEAAHRAFPPIDSAQDERSTSFASTSATTSVVSPTINLDHEYVRALQTESYNEVWSKIQLLLRHPEDPLDQANSAAADHNTGHPPSTGISAANILKPEQDVIDEVLRMDRGLRRVTSTKTHTLISSYFQSTEQASSLCLLLLRSIKNARTIYTSIYEVIDLFPSGWDSIGEHAAANSLQRDFISRRLQTFVDISNPFPSPPEDSGLQEMCRCISELRENLAVTLRRNQRNRRWMKRLEKGLGFCLIGTTAAVIASAMAVAAHALVAALLPPLNSLFLFSGLRLLSPKIAQLDAAKKGAFVLGNYFVTIDRLVSHLSDNVKDDKYRIQKTLDEASSRDARFYPCLILEVLKLISKNRGTFLERLTDLEEHVYIFFWSLNRSRADIIQQINQYQEQQGRLTAICC